LLVLDQVWLQLDELLLIQQSLVWVSWWHCRRHTTNQAEKPEEDLWSDGRKGRGSWPTARALSNDSGNVDWGAGLGISYKWAPLLQLTVGRGLASISSSWGLDEGW